MKRTFISLLLMLILSFGLRAYSQKHHLRLGDLVPNVQLNHLINYQTTKAMLSDFKSKLLILDFWDVYCASCIAHMPRMEALQKAFPDDIRVLLVTRSSEKQVKDLIGRNQIVRACKLPMLIADSTLSPFFSYQSVPAYAWIDRDGVLKHFTSSAHFLSEAFIRQFLDGKQLIMPLKDEYGDFNYAESLLTEGGGRNLSKLDYYSLISHWVNYDGQFVLPLIDKANGQRVGIHILNQSRVNLFLSAYSDSLPSNGFKRLENRVVLNLPDSVNYQPFEQHYLDDQWKQKNLFCYEARLPSERLHLIKDVMQRDLSTYFGVRAQIENQIKFCLVLKALNPFDPGYKIRSKGGESFTILPNNRDSLVTINSAFEELLFSVEMLFKSMNGSQQILLNETHIDPSLPIDLRMGGNLKDREEFRRQLRIFGLDLVPELKSIPMLILSN